MGELRSLSPQNRRNSVASRVRECWKKCRKPGKTVARDIVTGVAIRAGEEGSAVFAI